MDLSAIGRAYVSVIKFILDKTYMRRYLKLSAAKRKDIEKWIPVIAGARLRENMPGEREWLLGLIRKHLRKH